MASPTGGRWIFSVDTTSGFTGVNLGINNGVAPVFPAPAAGKFNIEVFTNPTVAGVPGVPAPGTGFQSSIEDPGGTLDNNGFLTGTNLTLTTGDFLAVDATTQGGAKITLGSGKQTVVGAKFDTLVGGSGAQILHALFGNETVIGGTGNESIWGGSADSIVAGSAANQIVVTGTGTTVVAGLSGFAVVSLEAQNTVTSLAGSSQNIVIAAGVNNLIDLTGNSGLAGIIGAAGDTITGGSGTTNINGASGGMLIKVGGGTTNVTGSTVSGPTGGDTLLGGNGSLGYNPGGTVAGHGDFINLAGSAGAATINSFSFAGTIVAAPDTIVAGNGSDSVFAGAGDRVGIGAGSVVGGTHLWDESDTTTGAVGFGTNDTVSSTTYDTASGFATRHPEVAGSSSAAVTVTNFDTAPGAGQDFIFYQNETAATTNNIITTAKATTVGGTASTVLILPDGTQMTLVGVTTLTSALFKP